MRKLLVIILLIAIPVHSFAWGKRGHDVICYIAERHLTPRTMERVTELLDGRSIVYYGNWMDSASRTPQYDDTYTWHYFNMDLRDDVASADREPKGDILSAVEQLTEQLRDAALSDEQESIALKMLIHLVGDMHQPLHLGRKEDRGGGEVPVIYFTESTSMHAAWDYHLVDGCHAWSYTEWGEQIDRLSEERVAEIERGGFADWLNATHEVTRDIYRRTPREYRIYYEYLDYFTPIIEEQLLYAGVRLAYLLNAIYDKSTAATTEYTTAQ